MFAIPLAVFSLMHADVVREPLQTGVSIEMGQIRSSYDPEASRLVIQRS